MYLVNGTHILLFVTEGSTGIHSLRTSVVPAEVLLVVIRAIPKQEVWRSQNKRGLERALR